MNMLWASSLYLLILIPLAVIAYVWILRRRRRFVIRYSSLSLVRDAAAHQSQWRRHAPFVLFLLALTSLILALTRPTAEIIVPSNRATIILALDISRSMCSTDIPPNRLIAAQAAATEFVQSRNEDAQIGIVAFAGFAELVQPPTKDKDLLINAIANLIPARRTAIGSAILRSIDAIAEIDNRIPPTQLNAEQTPSGEYAPHIIVLLTDGSSNAPFSVRCRKRSGRARHPRVHDRLRDSEQHVTHAMRRCAFGERSIRRTRFRLRRGRRVSQGTGRDHLETSRGYDRWRVLCGNQRGRAAKRVP